MGLRDPNLLRLWKPGGEDHPEALRARVEAALEDPDLLAGLARAEAAPPRTKPEVIVVVEPRRTSTGAFRSEVSRALDAALGLAEEPDAGVEPEGATPHLLPPRAPLEGSWRRDLERALDDLESADVSPAERRRLSQDPGQAAVQALLREGPGGRDLDQGVARHPLHPQPWTRRGIARARAGDLAGAVEDYTQALALQEDYLPALANRASAQFHLGSLDGVERDCTRALSAAPDLATAYLFRGIARARTGREGAQDDLYRFLHACPYSPFVRLIRETLKEIANWDEEDDDEG